mgnify:CR=1 FL=1
MQHVKKLPGFRSGSRRNAVIASVIYAVVILAVIGALLGGGDDDQPAAAIAPTATSTAASPPATSERPTASEEGATVTDQSSRYLDAARAYLAELDEQVAAADAGSIDDIAWSAWSRDWNQRRQTDYQACLAARAGVDACAPLDLVRGVMVAEHDRLWNQGDPGVVSERRTRLAEMLR